MKKRTVSLSTALAAWLQSTVLSLSALLCLSQAFSLELDFLWSLGVCAALSVLAVLCMLPRRLWIPSVLLLVAAGALVFWQRELMGASLGHLLFRVTTELHGCFSYIPVFGLEQGHAALYLWLLAIPLTWSVSWVCCRQGSLLLLGLLYAPIYVLVLVIVDLAPVFWLTVLTTGLLLLLLTQSVREQSTEEGSLLTWWLLLPTMILVLGITVLWPPADYTQSNFSRELQALMTLEDPVEQLANRVQDHLPTWNRELESVDLSAQGPKPMTGRSVLDYQADTRIFYLRGSSLTIYEDNHWLALDQKTYRAEQFAAFPLLSREPGDHLLQVRTRRPEPLLYTAYDLGGLPAAGQPVDDAYLQNMARTEEYGTSYAPDGPCTLPQGYDDFVSRVYLQVPEALQEPLREILTREGLKTAEQVAAYVRDSGVYDVMTPRVPAGEDFVLYFLQQSHRGYCVHFASAAVLLLRTAGIPARYVTGYSVSGEPGRWNTVLDDQAHAWAEYYVAGEGWRPLDPTPADLTREPAASADPVLPPEPGQTEQTPAVPRPVPEPEAQEGTQQVPVAGKPARGLLLLLLPMGAAAALLLRRVLVCSHRRDRCRKARPNRRALTYWRWLVALCGVQQKKPTEEQLCLAEKAKFSQHTLTEEELRVLSKAVDEEIAALQQAPLYRRLWYQYGRNLY